MIEITAYTADDKPYLQELFLYVRQSTFTWLPPSSFHLSDFDKETKDEYILVARLNHRIAGFISVWMPEHFIHHLYVDTSLQRKGIGRALLQALFSELKATFQLKCLLKNEAAIAFYKINGFIEKETVTDKAGDYGLFQYTSN